MHKIIFQGQKPPRNSKGICFNLHLVAFWCGGDSLIPKGGDVNFPSLK